MRLIIAKKTSLVVAAFLLVLLPAVSPAQERFFDEASASHTALRLAVFRPSIGTIKAMAAIKKMGFLDIPDLVVIGVYHEKEATDYSESRKYVQDNNLDWFHFHAVAGDVGESELFRINACTPEFEKIFSGSDGIILTGGPDIPPRIYGQKTALLTDIQDPRRHEFEVSAVFHLLGGFQDETFKSLLETRPGFPILGICLGCQSLNVGAGGTLIQDIWSEVYGKTNAEDIISLGLQFWHNNPFVRLYPQEKLIAYNFHRIRIDIHGKFCTGMDFQADDRPRVLSSHHQALAKLGRGFRVIATSLDGKIVEAVEHDRYPGVLGVQFHPEHPMLWDKESLFKQKPQDQPFSFQALLEGTPPSYAFNKAIWNWLGRAMKENRTSLPTPAISSR